MNEAPENKSDRLLSGWTELHYHRLAWVLIAAGVLVRLRFYLFNRSLWLDEAMLSLNLLDASFPGPFKDLEYGQAAPPVFLLLERLMVIGFGSSEFVLRLLPFLAGMLLLPLFYYTARAFLRGPALCVSVLGLAICGPLIYYSGEVKQYSSDATIALLLLLLTLNYENENQSWKTAILLAFIGAVALWSSHSALFVLGAVFAYLITLIPRPQSSARGQRLALIGGIWLISFIPLFFLILQGTEQNGSLSAFHADAFAPFPPLSWRDLRWHESRLFSYVNNPLGFTMVGLVMVLAGAGSVSFYRRNWRLLLLLLLPLVLAYAASVLKKYPFSDRLLLFSVPMTMILIGEGFSCLVHDSHPLVRPMRILVAATLVVHPLGKLMRDAWKPFSREETREMVNGLQRQISAGDWVLLHTDALPGWRYYTNQNLLPRVQVQVIPSWFPSAEADTGFCLTNSLRGRVWLVFSHTQEAAVIASVQRLGKGGKQLSEIKQAGASAYLYEFPSANRE